MHTIATITICKLYAKDNKIMIPAPTSRKLVKSNESANNAPFINTYSPNIMTILLGMNEKTDDRKKTIAAIKSAIPNILINISVI